MVTIDTTSAIEIGAIVVTAIIIIFAYLIRKLQDYEHRITRLETKIEDFEAYFRITTEGLTNKRLKK